MLQSLNHLNHQFHKEKKIKTSAKYESPPLTDFDQ